MTDEVTLLCAIPAFLAQPIRAALFRFRWEPSAHVMLLLLELLPRVCSGPSLDPPSPQTSENRSSQPPGSSPERSTEVTRTFTTPEILCWEQTAGAFSVRCV